MTGAWLIAYLVLLHNLLQSNILFAQGVGKSVGTRDGYRRSFVYSWRRQWQRTNTRINEVRFAGTSAARIIINTTIRDVKQFHHTYLSPFEICASGTLDVLAAPNSLRILGPDGTPPIMCPPLVISMRWNSGRIIMLSSMLSQLVWYDVLSPPVDGCELWLVLFWTMGIAAACVVAPTASYGGGIE